MQKVIESDNVLEILFKRLEITTIISNIIFAEMNF